MMILFGISVTVAAEFNPSELPSQIRGCYGGFQLKGNDAALNQLTTDFLKNMETAKFNTCDLKIHFFGAPESKWFGIIAALAEQINRHGMVFTAYTYPVYPGKGKDKDFPKAVDKQGRTIHNRYNLFDDRIWEEILKQAFVLAEFSRRIPIVAVKIDLEELVLKHFTIPYNKDIYDEFCSLYGLSPNVAQGKRYEQLEHSGNVRRYHDFLENKLTNIVKKLRLKMHRINPRLHLGMMPGENHLIYRAFMRELGTREVPAIIDNWSMYNGNGFIDNVRAAVDYAKEMNPHNLAVSWLRINNYYPQSIAGHIYHAAHYGNGYSSWELSMLAPDNKRSQTYQLPAGYTPSQYWQAYEQANNALAKDDGRKPSEPRLKLEKIVPFIAQLKLDDIQIPKLVPRGKGYRKSHNLTLRDRQIIYFYSKTNETVHVEIHHDAGDKRPQSLQYAVIDKNRNILRNETVATGEKHRFEISLPYTGIAALAVTGGQDGYGYAWYQVNIDSSHMGLDTSHTRGYFFNPPPPLYCTGQNSKLTASTSKNEIFEIIFNSTPPRQIEFASPSEFKLNNDVSKIIIRRPEETPKGYYTQDIFFRSSPENPVYLSDHPERMLIPAER